MVKRIIGTILLAVMLMGGSGCMNILPQTDESIRDEILEQLNKKYNKVFEGLALDRGHKDLLLCHVQGTDPEADLVHAKRVVRNDGVEYNDTYFGIIIRNEVEAEILSVCSDVDMSMKVIFDANSSYYDNIFDGTKGYGDLKEWIRSGNPYRFTVTIVLPIEDVLDGEGYAEQIFAKLTDFGYQGLVYVCTLPGEGFEQATSVNLNSLIRQYGSQAATHTQSIN